jgi:DNA-binding IclR family transcriptional regulator
MTGSRLLLDVSINGQGTGVSPLSERNRVHALDVPIDVVGRVAALLRVVANSEPKGIRTSAAADASGLARPTAHRLLTALNKEGFVDRSATGLWCMGPELFLLGLGAAPRYDARNLAQPILRRLAVATGESASFSVRRGDETVCLLHEEGTFPLRSHVLREGVRFPLGVASAGIAILAFMPEGERSEFLETVDLVAAWGEEHRPDRLRIRLAAARDDGYSINPGLVFPGSWGMAAAVFDHDERPVGALSLTGIEARFGPERHRALGAQLLHAARGLSLQIRPPTALSPARDSL